MTVTSTTFAVTVRAAAALPYAGYTPTMTATTVAELRAALQAATAGAIIGVDPGVYTATWTQSPTRFIPIFNTSNSGSLALGPIRIVAKYPATLYPANPELWTELRNGASDFGLSQGGAYPTFGVSQRSYVEWIGFSVNEAVSYSAVDTGPTVLHGASNCAIKYCEIRGAGAVFPSGELHNGVRIDGCTGGNVVSYNHIQNFYSDTVGSNNSNGSGILLIAVGSCIVEHNEIEACGGGIFVKRNYVEPGNLTFRYNYIHDCAGAGIRVDSTLTSGSAYYADAYQNLVVGCGYAFMYALSGGATAPNYRICNNTISNCTWGHTANAAWGASDAHQFFNNIVSGASHGYFWSSGTGVTTSQFNAEHNLYDNVTTLADVNGEGGGGTTSLATWQSLGQDDDLPAAITGNPLFVGGGSFKLQAGSPALTLGRDVLDLGGAGVGATIPAGCYLTGTETIGIR